MISPEQSRAARALLRWKQACLADRAGVGLSTVSRFERGESPTQPRCVEAMRIALEGAGIMFMPQNGEDRGVLGVCLTEHQDA